MRILYLFVLVLSLSLSESYRVRRQAADETIPEAGIQPDETTALPNEAEESAAEEIPAVEAEEMDILPEEIDINLEEKVIEPIVSPPKVDTRKTLPGPCSGNNRACVPYYSCKVGKTVSDGEFGTLTTSNGIIKKHSECTKTYFDVCCEEQFEEGAAPVEEFPNPGRCGLRNTNGVGAFVSDLPSIYPQFGEFSWMAAILLRDTRSGTNQNICGGSIIEPRVILTSAHCIYKHKASQISIRAGEWDVQFKEEPIKEQNIEAQEIIVNPDFVPDIHYNNFALIILKTPLEFNPAVNPICLPDVNDVFDGGKCFASGFGKNKFGARGNFERILKKIDLTVVNNTECQNSLRKTRLGSFFELHDSFTCAVGKAPDEDTCQGDGGSPLVCPKTDNSGDEAYFQAGIVSWGIGCGDEKVPGVYADVTKGLAWINENKAPFV